MNLVFYPLGSHAYMVYRGRIERAQVREVTLTLDANDVATVDYHIRIENPLYDKQVIFCPAESLFKSREDLLSALNHS